MDFADAAYSGSFNLLIQNQKVEFLNASLKNNGAENILLCANNSDQRITLAFASALPLNQRSLEIELRFKSKTESIPTANDFAVIGVVIDDHAATITVVAEQTSEIVPTQYQLSQNYPNPFNPETSIRFDVPEKARVKIEIFNLMGQHIQTLFDNERNAGSYEVLWNGLDKTGQPVVSGVYLCKMSAGEFSAIRKMALVR